VKRKLLIIISLLVALLAIGIWRFNAPFRVINKLDAQYQQVKRGMTTNEVAAMMNYSVRWETNQLKAWWDDSVQGEAETERIRFAMQYSVSTFFLPVTFEFAFDENGRVIGRHRYD
jgi:hypothetical protein